MVLFGVDLKPPGLTDWMLVPFAGAAGGYIGALIHQHVGGSMAPVAGLAASGAVCAAMAMAGADTDAGWRGVGLSFCASLVAFTLGTGIASAVA